MTTGFLGSIAAIGAQLSEISERPAWSMSGDELAAALRELARLRAKAAELERRLAHQASVVGLGSEVGAEDTRAWWSNTTRQTRRDTHRRLALAAALDEARGITREAMTGRDWARFTNAGTSPTDSPSPRRHRPPSSASLPRCV